MTQDMTHSDALDRSGRLMIVGLTLVESVLLMAAHDGMDAGWGVFATVIGRTLWYSLGIVLPLIAALLLNTARDGYAVVVTAVAALLLMPLAWHTGAACSLQGNAPCSPVFSPYVWALSAAIFVALPYLQAGRRHGVRAPYADLFHYAWDNFLTLGAALIFTAVGWLILLLWSELFELIGIGFFKALFGMRHFIYPVTGLFAGFGLMLARSQQGALHSVLRVCLALGRGLLPLISILAIVFLIALAFTGLQPLWATRHAATLLLALIVFVVVLVNAAFQDGAGPSPAGTLRHLVGAALLTLPIYAAIVLYALHLRTSQYGWTVDRLWAMWAAVIALLYTGAYAFAAFARGVWLARMAPANKLIALLFAGSLLLTQSPWLDFRNIATHSQIDRWERGIVKLDAVDFEHLRWELGQSGLDALQRLAADSRVKADARSAQRIAQLLGAKDRWEAREAMMLAPADFVILPKGASLPDGLLSALNGKRGLINADFCEKLAQSCVLLAADLNGDGQNEWVFANVQGWTQLPVFALREGQWQNVGWLHARDGQRATQILKTLAHQKITVEAPQWKDLRIGDERLSFQAAQP